MAEEKENTTKVDVRLPTWQVKLIDSLKAEEFLGSNRSAVMRSLLSNASVPDPVDNSN